MRGHGAGDALRVGAAEVRARQLTDRGRVDRDLDVETGRAKELGDGEGRLDGPLDLARSGRESRLLHLQPHGKTFGVNEGYVRDAYEAKQSA